MSFKKSSKHIDIIQAKYGLPSPLTSSIMVTSADTFHIQENPNTSAQHMSMRRELGRRKPFYVLIPRPIIGHLPIRNDPIQCTQPCQEELKSIPDNASDFFPLISEAFSSDESCLTGRTDDTDAAVNTFEMGDVTDMTIHEKGVATKCSDDMDSTPEQNEFHSIHGYYNLENGCDFLCR